MDSPGRGSAGAQLLVGPVEAILSPGVVKTVVVSVSIREQLPDTFTVPMSAPPPVVPPEADLPLSSIPVLPLPADVMSSVVLLVTAMRLIWWRMAMKMW